MQTLNELNVSRIVARHTEFEQTYYKLKDAINGLDVISIYYKQKPRPVFSAIRLLEFVSENPNLFIKEDFNNYEISGRFKNGCTISSINRYTKYNTMLPRPPAPLQPRIIKEGVIPPKRRER